MLALIPILLVGLAAHWAWSLRFAYRLERYELAAGYPILGHAFGSLIVPLAIGVCLRMAGQESSWAAKVTGVSIVVLPVLHWWLLVKVSRLGEKHRLAASRGAQ